MPLELGAFMHPTTADSDSNARPDAGTHPSPNPGTSARIPVVQQSKSAV